MILTFDSHPLGLHFLLWPKKREKCFLMEFQTDFFFKKSVYLHIFQAVKCVNQASDLCPLTRVTCRNTVNQFSGLHLDSYLSMYVVK